MAGALIRFNALPKQQIGKSIAPTDDQLRDRIVNVQWQLFGLVLVM